ncbi:hypothetical protein RhiTH_011305 [Rhizoctonia solani]
MTKIRLKSRKAIIPKFQQWVASLNRQGLLRRCYTQNFDGLQLRDDCGMAGKVYEIHGSNQRLRCPTCSQACTRPIQDLDHELAASGLVKCSNCIEIGKSRIHERVLVSNLTELSAKNAAALNKRPRPVGYLVPDVLFNQQMEDISWENKGWDLGFDTEVDLFIIAGTALKTPGTFKLVKAMAQNTQKYGGIVVYLNRAKPSKSLSSFIDVHFQIEADLFPDFFNKINREEFTPGTESIREQAIKAFDQISRLTPQQLLPIAELSSNHEYDVETQTQKRIPFFTKIKLIIFYTPQHGMEVDKYGQQLMQRLHEQEYQVELSQIRIGSFNNIPVVESRGFHVLYVFLTSSGVDRHAAPASQDMEVAEGSWTGHD